MRKLILLALVGLGAQLVDGSLGMAYGVTSTTLLLATGAVPAAASATVHLAEIGTTLVSGASHWRFGNVDWKVVGRIAVPGAVGSFAGATFLSSLSTETAEPIMSAILFILGVYILIRFTAWGTPRGQLGKPVRAWFLAPLGVFGGFVDATGGGGWGPVSTPALLATGRMEPRKVIGSVDTSEFIVALAASLGFLIGLGGENIPYGAVLALFAGGLVAAPIAAWLVRHIPGRVLGSLVGGVIVLTNTRTIMKSDYIDASDGARVVAYLVIAILWAAAIAWSVRAYRAERRELIAEAEAAAETESTVS